MRNYVPVSGTRATILAFLCLAGFIVSGTGSVARDFQIEAGSRVSADTFASLEETYVPFQQIFDEPPVVVTLMAQNGSNSATLRVTNVSRTGFFALIIESEGWDGEHVAVPFDYIAVTPGAHRLPSGEIISAGSISTTAVQHGAGVTGAESWATATFGDDLGTTAVVLAKPQTAFNESNPVPDAPAAPFITAAVQNATSSTVQLALERSESGLGTVTQAETIGWIAFPESGSGTFTDISSNTVSWAARTTPENIRGWSNGCFTNTHGVNSANAVVIASMATRNEDDGGWLRSCSKNATLVGLRVDEDRGNDSERGHVNEAAGIISFSRSFHARFTNQTLAGQVFADNGTGAGTAYNGIQDGAEMDLGGTVVSLILDASDTLLQAVETAADGTFLFEVPDSAIGQSVRLQVTPSSEYSAISETPGALPGLVNGDQTDSLLIFSPDAYDNYTDVRFGEVPHPALTEDNAVTTTSGGQVRLSHSYVASAPSDVTFTLVEMDGPGGGVVTYELYHDTDCSGEIDGAETVLTAPVSAVEGDEICVIIRGVFADTAPIGSSLSYRLVAETAWTGTGVSRQDENTDIITVGDVSHLSLVKEVCNITTETCDAADGTGFTQSGTGSPGDILQYRLVFSAGGSKAVDNIRLFDDTPEFSSLVPGSMTTAKAPQGISCSAVTPAGGGSAGYEGPVEWDCSGAAMLPGDEGVVAFNIEIEQ